MFNYQNQKTRKNVTKCDLCMYHTGHSCMVTPSKYTCKNANDEYYQYIRQTNNSASVASKSLRPWDKR